MMLFTGQPLLQNGNAAVHAARTLGARLLVAQVRNELAVVLGASRLLVALGDALELEESGGLAHYAASFQFGSRCGHFLQRATIFVAGTP
jgi:hypothetical protein